MSKIRLTRCTFETLVKHLADIEDERDRILEDYYPSLTKERDSFHQLITGYIKGIEDYIYNADIEEAGSSSCPFVIIGSTVEVEDLTNNEVEMLQIASPFTNKLNINSNCASYLSPLGKALLLRDPGDEVEIEAPAGNIVFRIKSIRLT
ncbi:MAG: hypothetical protein K0R84_1837 [Clostridia bacterium]|jgi:transcription elongation factor GreA|nr:hypothetical protein [Clostridia bacterium]